MRVLGIDLSTNTGWALFEDGRPVSHGFVQKSIDWRCDSYPANFIKIVDNTIELLMAEISTIKPDKIVVEEINRSGRFTSRFSQKILDMLHYALLKSLFSQGFNDVAYINTSDWRRTLRLSVQETRKAAKPYVKKETELKKAVKACKDKVAKKTLEQDLKNLKLEMKLKCIHGKIDKKSISVAYVNLTFDKRFTKGDNDITDAYCLVEAYLKGCPTVDNRLIFESKDR